MGELGLRTVDCGDCTRVLHRSAWRRPVAFAVMAGFTACTADPVVWDAPQYGPGVSVPNVTASCETASVTAAAGNSYRVWWQPLSIRPVFILAARRERDTVVVIDRRGERLACDALPPPFAFADSTNGFLHVTYYSGIPGRTGVYYAHSMNAPKLARRGGGMFEPPIAIVYGDRPARTSVASRADTVVVAYEDPNSPTGGIWIALSTTGGHAFSHWLKVSHGAAETFVPAVQLTGGRVRVAWFEKRGETTRSIVREGRFR